MSTVTQDMPQQLLRPTNVGDQAYAPPAVQPYQSPITNLVGAAPAMPAATVAKITTAICKVMAKVGVVEKEGRNEFFNYAYVRVQDVLQKLTPLMAEAGIAILQTEVERSLDDGGKALAIKYAFTVCHASGEVWPERLMWTGSSIARNRNGTWDDKAPNKCAVAARKYMLLSLFQVPSADIDDADRGENDGGDIKAARADARQDARSGAELISQSIYDQLRSELGALEESGASPDGLKQWGGDQGERINKLVSEHYDPFRKFFGDVLERSKAKYAQARAPAPPVQNSPTTPKEPEAAPDGRHNPVRSPASDYHAGSITNKPSELDDQLTENDIADLLEKK